jgi:hypothetical protein
MPKYMFSLKSIALVTLMFAMWSCPQAHAKSAKLTWSAPASQSGITITGYKVYRGTISGGQGSTAYATVTSGTVTTFTDTAITAGSNYFYKVTATGTCDSAVWDCSSFSNESAPSNEASSGVVPKDTAPGVGAPSAVTVIIQ